MSDARLRHLERTCRDSGSVADEAAWLRERVRLGRLDPERLALAATLGHEASIAVLGEPPPRFRPDPFFARFGREALVRVALAIAELARAQVPAGDPEEGLLDHMLHALRTWCVEPIGSASPDELTGRGIMAAEERSDSTQPRFWALHITANACGLTATDEPHHYRPVEDFARRHLRLSRKALLFAARRDVAPWALRVEDPVAIRLGSLRSAVDALAAAWRQDRSTERLAAWLEGRQRAGRLQSERVRLAAALGHPAALLVRGQGPPTAFEPAALTAAAYAVPGGYDAQVRVALAAARFARSTAPGRRLEAVDLALRAGEAWLACPCEAHREEAAARWRDLNARRAATTTPTRRAVREALRWCVTSEADGRPNRYPAPDSRESAMERMERHLAAERRRSEPLPPGVEDDLPLFRSCQAACTNALTFAMQALEQRGHSPDAARERLRQALRDAVAPWALGLADVEA
ncbi:MAG: hypothetical protein M9894_10105 [Planctomycetes bacterium]|nr:hypothetical protein [Planctomycetota bacterium]